VLTVFIVPTAAYVSCTTAWEIALTVKNVGMTPHKLFALIIFGVRFIVFTSLTFIVLFVFIYCISFSHPATVFQ